MSCSLLSLIGVALVSALLGIPVLFAAEPPAPGVVAAIRTEDSFMQQNANQPGVQTTASGLQYRVDRAAQGASPTLAHHVTVHYRGTLMDGTPFDSSYDRGEPTSFPLRGVIQGWQEGLQLMQVGSQYTFWIPPNLGYGPRGIPGVIPPNAVLVFQVELISFQ